MSNIVCPCCGVHRLTPKMPVVHEVPWGDCGCRDEHPCMAHAINPYADDVPSRPTDADLAERARQMYVAKLKEHMELMSRFHWVENKLKEVQ